VIVPTKYFLTPTVRFKELGISTVIWANHNLRASIIAMQNICGQIMAEQSLANIESKASDTHPFFTSCHSKILMMSTALREEGHTAMQLCLLRTSCWFYACLILQL
jgi:2-methylisocitrate lyase-like PEP mutase family enzyme